MHSQKNHVQVSSLIVTMAVVALSFDFHQQRALANTGDAGGPRYTFEAVFGAGGLSQIRRAL